MGKKKTMESNTTSLNQRYDPTKRNQITNSIFSFPYKNNVSDPKRQGIK